MDKNMRLYCRELMKSYRKKPVLSGCSLELRADESVGLVGENGSGKSTFVRCILGFTRPDSGIIRLGGHVGYCPQDNVLNRRYLVREHFELIGTILGRTTWLDRDFIDSCLERLKLKSYLSMEIDDLSSGTYQKIKFLTSIYHSPQLIVLDEPYGGFDWRMYIVFWEIIDELRAKGASILMISHLIYDRERFDRIFELRGGRLEQTG